MTRRLARITLAVLLTTLVAGCLGGGSNPNTSRITGTVVDVVSRSPVADASILVGSQTTNTLADGSFSLAVPPGAAILTIAKAGYSSYSQSVDVPASGLRIAEPILLYPPPSVIVPTFENGTATFTVNAPASDSRTLVMLFPQASPETEYAYSASFDPVGGGALRLVGTARKAESSIGLRLRSALLFNPYPRTHKADRHLRESEKRAGSRRNAILAQRRVRARLLGQQLSVGDPRSFKVYDWMTSDATGVDTWVTVQAELRAIGIHALIYAKADDGVTDTQVRNLLDFFDQKQLILTQAFGDELDVDGNGKAIILLTPMPYPWGTLYGYFDWGNELSPADNPDSNQADMIYINSTPLASEFATVKGTLAHEYQHLLHFSNRIANGSAINDAWINEGFSMLAEDIAGLGFLGGDAVALYQVGAWLDNGDPRAWSLTYWGGGNLDYGGDYLFARYFYDHYGPAGTLQVNQSADGGLKAVTDVAGGSFGNAFGRFLASVAYAGYKATPSDPLIGFTAPGFALGGMPKPWNVSYDATTTINSRWLGGPPLTMYAWGFDSFTINGGAPGAKVKVTLTAVDTAGDFGAVAVTWLREVVW